MKVKVSLRTNSYAIYVEKGDDDEVGERAVRIIAMGEPLWLKEVHDGRYKKIIVIP
jgi:hypothetical protein